MTKNELIRRLGVHTSYAAEWGWAAGRYGVIGAALVTTVLFLSESSAQLLVIGLLVFGSAYSTLLLYLLTRQRLQLVFVVGLILDNSALLVGWWAVTRSFAGSVQTNDLWLILIPLVIVGVVRLGWIVGSIYTALWIGWMAWSLTYYYAPDSYDVEQLPVRILFIVVIVGLVMRLVSLVGNQRDRELDRLHEVERLEALKSTLLRTVAHEVRSPMTAIRAAADILIDEDLVVQPAQRERVASALRSGIRRLERVVQESLAYAELKGSPVTLMLEEVDMRGLVSQAVQVVAAAARQKQQEVDVAAPQRPLIVRCDPARIEQVLVNLLTNAVQFAPIGSRIRISLRQDGSGVVTDIANTGPPIPESEQDLIFEEYYQGKAPDRGGHTSVGLGLAVAKRLTEAHGGGLSVTSEEAGTTFSLVLPAPPTR